MIYIIDLDCPEWDLCSFALAVFRTVLGIIRMPVAVELSKWASRLKWYIRMNLCIMF
jgi:hypothetical protein